MNSSYSSLSQQLRQHFSSENNCQVQWHAALNGTCLSLIEDLSIIQVSGAQASTFLQGQLTCDIRTCIPGQMQLGACCDHKGRMLANFWVWSAEGNYYLLLPSTMLTLILDHLKKYATFSKVELTQKTDWVFLNYSSLELTCLMDSSIHQLAQGAIASVTQPAHRLFWVVGPIENLLTVCQKLTKIATFVNDEIRQFLMILFKFVYLQPATSGLFLPQMINLERLGGVSFTKGCYLGQEVVSRTQYLGQLKRHIYELHCLSEKKPIIGDILKNMRGETVGHITAVSLDPEQGYRVLAVIQNHATSHELVYPPAQQIRLIQVA